MIEEQCYGLTFADVKIGKNRKHTHSERVQYHSVTHRRLCWRNVCSSIQRYEIIIFCWFACFFFFSSQTRTFSLVYIYLHIISPHPVWTVNRPKILPYKLCDVEMDRTTNLSYDTLRIQWQYTSNKFNKTLWFSTSIQWYKKFAQ